MRRVTIVLVLSVFLALGTALVGWWALPVLSLAGGYVLGRDRAPGIAAALAGAVAWGGLLVGYLVFGMPIGSFATRLAGAMQLPTAGLLVLSVAFPALLAGAAGAFGGQIRGGRGRLTSPTA